MNIIKDKRIFTGYVSSTTPYPLVYPSVTDDATVIVPAGYVLEFMSFLNSTANDAIISAGTTAGGTDVFTGQTVNGTGTNLGCTTFGLNFDRALVSSTTIYLHDNAPGDSWNSANVTIYLVLRKVL